MLMRPWYVVTGVHYGDGTAQGMSDGTALMSCVCQMGLHRVVRWDFPWCFVYVRWDCTGFVRRDCPL
ncbi:hypothetical protein A2U01_0054025 [Trifolium medium]|uniref:Uncharacterized protein n=1 Tax=Trifolium medium TaxID=97028 RepID=A0A392R8A6_9FABA|nr:hypothetical protein [Trifolium medium]